MPRASDYRRLDTPYPMVRLMQRTLPADYKGPAFVFDIDKTYLDTRFSQARHLIRIPFEFGIDKRAIGGMVELLHGVREGVSGSAHAPLFFVSASPPQLRRSLEKKMLLDGVEYDGLSYKDWARLLSRGEFDQIREQVAYKVAALLVLYRELPLGTTMYLFGDDAEYDALAYSLFADVAAGRLRGRTLHDSLVVIGAKHRYAEVLASFSYTLPEREAVGKIFINLVRGPDGTKIAPFSKNVLGCPTAAAACETLVSLNLLSAQSAKTVQEQAGPSSAIPGSVASDPLGLWTAREFLVL